ncbi:MAG: hypothetical protein AB7O66_05615 [Limisphaerales bacterium]
MNRIQAPTRPTWRRPALAAIFMAAAAAVVAFPPAPHHLVFGMVRDEFGNPLNAPGAEVILDIDGAAGVRSSIAAIADANSEGGFNYRLPIPLDSGVTADLYKPSALRPVVPFRMRVRVGSTIYLPIEMTGAAKVLTEPGADSRVDLTLGIDSDGDGIPDAWEEALIAATGGGRSLKDILPNQDDDRDGLTNLQEYLAGTYAFDPADGFALAIVSTSAGRSLLEFTAIRGRTYSIQASDDAKSWITIPFTLASDAADTPERRSYLSQDVRPIRAQVGPAETSDSSRFFRLVVR